MTVERHLAAVEQISTSPKLYSDAFKAAIVARLDGQPLAQVSRETGIARNTLRAWRDAEPAAPSGPPEAGVEAALTGSRREVLEALRAKVADLIDGGISSRDMPANARLLMEISKEIDAIDARESEEEERAEVQDEPFDPYSI